MTDDEAPLEEWDSITVEVEVELPERIARTVASRVTERVADGEIITETDVERMALDYGQAVEQFTVAGADMPLVAWLREETDVEIAGPDDD